MAGGRGFGAGTAGKGISIRTLPATFDLKEEFVVAGNNAGARGAMQPGFSSPDMMMPTAGGKANATESTEDADPDDSRYLSNVAAYRTRGFRLQVTIHQLQVPELIRELLNSKYPIEIIRFQQMALNPDETGAPGVSSGVPGRSMAGGVPGGPGYPGVGSATAGSAGKGSAASDEAANAEAAFDPTAFAGADGTGTADSSETTNVSIQTALGELDLVDLVVDADCAVADHRLDGQASARLAPGPRPRLALPLAAITCLTQRGHVIDVHPELQHGQTLRQNPRLANPMPTRNTVKHAPPPGITEAWCWVNFIPGRPCCCSPLPLGRAWPA